MYKVEIFSWSSLHKQADSDLLPTFPTLPGEIWRKIIAFTTRFAGAKAIELDDPFCPPYINEEYPEIDRGIFHDRKSLMRVCSSWRETVTEFSAEYLIIYTGKQLKNIVKRFESNKNHAPKSIGRWTTRIDFKILENYSVDFVVRLLHCTPNLLIYDNKNGPPTRPARYTPLVVITALATHCRDIKRLQWSGAGECPRYQDLVELCNGLPNLTTLRLISMYSYPGPASGIPTLVAPKLKTLSLAPIPSPDCYIPYYRMEWDTFLHYAANHVFLPALERFEADFYPADSLDFFRAHGSRLRFFRTSSHSPDEVITIALDLCPNLEILVIAQGSTYTFLPATHLNLRKICILPMIDVDVGIPERIFLYAVHLPLDSLLRSIEGMILPRLSEVRIRNCGAFMNIAEDGIWLRLWWIRIAIKGAKFCDKSGVSFEHIQCSAEEQLLNSVRS